MVCAKAFTVLLRKKFYLPSAIITAVLLFLLLAFLHEILFFNPFAFFVPQSETFVFTLLVTISVLAGLTLPLAVYKIFNYKFSIGNSKEFLAVVLGISATCGCSAALSIITVTGSVGSSLVGFLNLYQNHIRLLTIALLIYSFYLEVKFLDKIYCK